MKVYISQFVIIPNFIHFHKWFVHAFPEQYMTFTGSFAKLMDVSETREDLRRGYYFNSFEDAEASVKKFGYEIIER